MRSLVLGCATAIGLMALLAIIVVRSLPTDRPPTPDELRSIPDVALLYPDAVETARSDRPGAYAFFNDQLTEARTTYRADASAESVGAWYDAALTSDGWVRQPEFRSSGPSQPTSFWRWCHPEVDADL